jgi:DUF4097 and DUF4098 domain-containing protein YvlB
MRDGGHDRRSTTGGVALSAVVALALAFATTALSACDAGMPRVTRNEHRTFEVPVGAHTDVAVGTFNGHINVTAVGEGKVDVSVTAYARARSTDIAQSALDMVAVKLEQGDGTVIVTAAPSGDGPAGSERGADVDVVLPRNSSLTLVTSNGRIEAINVQGYVLATTSNGEIVTRAGHDVHLESSNGSITMSKPQGAVVARTSNAAVDILDADRVSADVFTSNGAIAFSGTLAPGDHRFQTSNAGLSLRLPADQGFSIDGHTTNATATTDFAGLTAAAGSVSGTVGDGSARITAEASNGTLSVTRLAP